MTLSGHRRLAIALALALVSGLVLPAAIWLDLLATLQARSADFLFRAKTGETSGRVAIVAIDDRSLRELAGDGRLFAWPRDHYGRVVTALAEAGARVIVLDVLFDAPAQDDAALADSVAKAGNVVLPVAGDVPGSSENGRPPQYDMLATPVPSLVLAAAGLGHANLDPDGDGAVRRVQVSITSGDQEVPALALAAAARYLRRPAALEGPPRDGYLLFAGRAIPIADRHRGMLVNYLGPPYQPGRQSPFPIVSFVDVLRGQADLKAFRDRVVLVGLVTTGFADDYWTPPSIGRKMSGVEIHASAVETILRPAFLRPVSATTTGLMAVLFAVVAGLGAYRLRVVPSVALALGLVLTYFVAAFALFDFGLLLNLVYPPLAPMVAFGAVVLYRVLFVEADQRAARRMLAGYLSPAVMHEVLREPGRLRLGGTRREMTVLFSDIRDFTAHSEQLDPQLLVGLLNEYLTEMSAVVFEHGGVVDKFVGDGLMAFWGAPMAQEDHARRACLAALGMVRRIRTLHTHWQQAGFPQLAIGVGVNTGVMSVGNMGSQERFSYTVIGDAVNLAARLEPLNKEYGTSVLATEATLLAAGGGFDHRFIGRLAIRGKTEPVSVYELLEPERPAA